jgi:hypothetical protein
MKLICGASRPLHFKIGAAGIMWWEETPASHVYIRLTIYGVDIVFQAVGAGTCFLSFEKFKSHNIVVYEKEFTVTPEMFEKIISFMLLKLGTKYSVKHLCGLFYKRLIQYTTKKIVKNPFKDGSESDVCVEVMAEVMDMAEIKRTAIDPEDMGIYEALQTLYVLHGTVLVGDKNAIV